MDIYFQGYGFWFTENEPGEPLNKLTSTYLANGVFRLNDKDSVQFWHTKSIDCSYTLYPSTHKDDEFSKVAKGAQLKGYNPERCWFSIDSSINACTGIEKIAVIAEPDSPSGVLVEHVETPIAANKFSIDALIETRIPALFIKAKIYNDPFTQGTYKTLWVKMLEKERDYLSGLDFSDLRESRLQRINAKLKDFQEWARANDVSQGDTEPASLKNDVWRDDSSLTKLEKQHKAILEVIALKNFSPMAIPDGEKSGSIKTICETDYPLIFDCDNSFDEAWKKGRSKKLFRMANHASYAKRGRE
jgi:hypothetical protein